MLIQRELPTVGSCNLEALHTFLSVLWFIGQTPNLWESLSLASGVCSVSGRLLRVIRNGTRVFCVCGLVMTCVPRTDVVSNRVPLPIAGDDVANSGETPAAAVVVDAGTGAVGGKSSFERVLDNCENPFAKRPLLPYADDRVVTSEGDLTPNGRDLSPPSRPTSLWLGPGAAARNASDTCGRLPGRVVFPTSKKYKPIVVADVTSALKADAAEQTSLSRKPAVPPKKPLAHRKPDGGLVVDGKQRGRMSPVGGRQTGDGRKPGGVRTEQAKEKVYARVSGILCEEKTGDSAKVSMAGLADAIAACGWQGQQFNDSDSTAPLQPADSSESTAHPNPDNSSESPVRPSVDSSLRPKPVSIVSPVGTSVDADESPVVPVPDPVAPTADSAADDDIDAKTSARTCTTVAPTTTASKPDAQRPVFLYFFLFVTVCAYVGCSLQSYPANFIFVVTALSMISFRLLLRRADFLGTS